MRKPQFLGGIRSMRVKFFEEEQEKNTSEINNFRTKCTFGVLKQVPGLVQLNVKSWKKLVPM